MALRFIDGFEHYTIPDQLGLKYTNYYSGGSGSNTITTMTGRRSGSTALLFRYASDYAAMTFESQQTWIVGFALYNFANETAEILRFNDESSTTQACVSVGADGTIRVHRGSFSSGTILATSANALPLASWNYIEVKITVADSGGIFQVRVNETMWIDFTGDTKQTTLASINRILLIGRGTDNGFDDYYICDTTGSINNDFLGDVRVDTVRPIGVGGQDDFNTQGGSTNWENVDDTAPDADSSYNYSNTVGHKDVLDCGNLPSVTGSIFGIQLNMTARKDDAGARTLRALARLDSTDYEGASINISTSYNTYVQIFEQNPDTEAAWVEAEINGAEFGYKVHA